MLSPQGEWTTGLVTIGSLRSSGWTVIKMTMWFPPHRVRCRPLIRITPWPRSPEMEYVSWLASHRIYRHYPCSCHLRRGRTVKLTKGWINFSWSYKPKLGILLLSPMPWRGTRMLETGSNRHASVHPCRPTPWIDCAAALMAQRLRNCRHLASDSNPSRPARVFLAARLRPQLRSPDLPIQILRRP